MHIYYKVPGERPEHIWQRFDIHLEKSLNHFIKFSEIQSLTVRSGLKTLNEVRVVTIKSHPAAIPLP